MKGYFLSTTNNTNDLVVYENGISVDYKDFLEGKRFDETEIPLFFHVQKQSYLNNVKKAIMLYSSGPTLVSKQLKEVLEVNTNDVQFFNVELYCENERIEGFYAINLLYKIPCIDIEKSEYRLTNFDPNNPTYMFYYMKLKENVFDEENNFDVVRCKEMNLNFVVNDKIKEALFEAKFKGLQFSDSIDITPQERTIYEKI